MLFTQVCRRYGVQSPEQTNLTQRPSLRDQCNETDMYNEQHLVCGWVTATEDCGAEESGREMVTLRLMHMQPEAQTTARGRFTDNSVNHYVALNLFWLTSTNLTFLWNSLPTKISQPASNSLTSTPALSRDTFHKQLKTHLFSHSFPP